MSKQQVTSPADAAAQRVLDCRAVIVKIEGQHSELAARREALALARKNIAFNAASGNAEAKLEIERLRSEAIAASAELEDTEIALSTAQARLREALAAQARVGDIERARKIRAAAVKLKRLGSDIDDSAASLARSFAAMEAGLQDLRALGIDHPSRALSDVNLKRSLNASLVGLAGRLEIKLIPPGERVPFATLADGWGKSAERSASILEAGDSKSEAA
jgi:hypothetical protein